MSGRLPLGSALHTVAIIWAARSIYATPSARDANFFSKKTPISVRIMGSQAAKLMKLKIEFNRDIIPFFLCFFADTWRKKEKIKKKENIRLYFLKGGRGGLFPHLPLPQTPSLTKESKRTHTESLCMVHTESLCSSHVSVVVKFYRFALKGMHHTERDCIRGIIDSIHT